MGGSLLCLPPGGFPHRPPAGRVRSPHGLLLRPRAWRTGFPGGHPETLGGSSPPTGPPGPPSATGGGVPRGPLGPLILGGAKKCTFLAPCGAKSWGSGGAPPTNLILLRNQRTRVDAASRERAALSPGPPGQLAARLAKPAPPARGASRPAHRLAHPSRDGFAVTLAGRLGRTSSLRSRPAATPAGCRLAFHWSASRGPAVPSAVAARFARCPPLAPQAGCVPARAEPRGLRPTAKGQG